MIDDDFDPLARISTSRMAIRAWLDELDEDTPPEIHHFSSVMREIMLLEDPVNMKSLLLEAVRMLSELGNRGSCDTRNCRATPYEIIVAQAPGSVLVEVPVAGDDSEHAFLMQSLGKELNPALVDLYCHGYNFEIRDFTLHVWMG